MKESTSMIIDHIGLVVKNIEKAVIRWVNMFGYVQATEVVMNARQMVRVVFLEKNNSVTIKLTEPTSENSPIFKFAKRGGGLHHLCFRCSEIDEQLVELKEKGCRVLTLPEPGEAFENENIAFLFAKDGLNIELIDTEKKAKRI